MTDAVPPAMRGRIEAELAAVEAAEGVRILLAIESGSRAWGFHSPDSDFDVRFVYVRPVDWHLALLPGRDVVERPVDAVLDVSGWDLRKALTLMLGGNAVIGEWLRSPIVYRRRAEADGLGALADRALTRRPASWHYLRLAERQMARLEGPGGGVRLKRFLYALRPALALRWMRLNDRAHPPMDMGALVAGAALGAPEAAAVRALVAEKRAQSELGTVPAVDSALAALVGAELDRARGWLGAAAPDPPDATVRAAAEAFHVACVRAMEAP